MSALEREVAYREGRGEMKYDVFQEIVQLKKEVELNPSMDDATKTQYERLLSTVENRMQKL